MTIRRRLAMLLASMVLLPLAPAAADNAAPSLAAQLVGKTLSAVVFLPRPPGAPGGGALQRIVLQAYLEADGRSLMRQWLPARDAYSAPMQTHWRLRDNTLCLDLPNTPLCAAVHIWGPRIAGINQRPYAMLDGDLQPGNALTGPR